MPHNKIPARRQKVAPGQASNLAAASTHEEQLRPMEDEAETIRALRTPKTVRDVECEAHEAAGHTPYRDWRVPCVTGAGRRIQHRQRASASSENLKPLIFADCAYMNDRNDAAKEAASASILVT